MKGLIKTGALARVRGIAENIYPVRAEGDELKRSISEKWISAMRGR